MTVLSNIITPSNVLTTTNTATVTNKTLTSPTVAGMTVSDGTANGVTYLNGSKVLTSGSALTFDGSRLFLGTTAVTTSSSQSGEVYSSGVAGFMFTNTTAANYALSVKNEGTSGTRNLINFYEGTGGGSARANISLDGSANFAITSSTSLVFSPSSAEGMRLTSTGLGIGTSSPSAKLHVSGDAIANTFKLIANTTVSGSDATIFRPADNTMAFSTNGSERARIDSSGNLLVGTTTVVNPNPGISLTPGSGSQMAIGHGNGQASGTYYAYFVYNGTVIGSITQSGTTAVLYNTTSDQRLKENIQDADSASSLIDSLQVRKFDWKADGSHQRYGFVAQELVTVYPEAVHQPIDTEDMMAVDYSKLVPLLVKEIQSLKARLDAANL